MRDILLLLAAANAVLAIPMMLLWRRDFARLGHVSPFAAAWSGVVMHGHALITFALAWIDRGSMAAPTAATMIMGGALIVAGAGIIGAGRFAYGSQARVYGLLEDKLIESGIYRWTRNPQYFGYWMMFMGAALAGLSGWALALALAFAPAVHLHITLVEEPHLARTFGNDYRAYCARVARYFGPPRR